MYENVEFYLISNIFTKNSSVYAINEYPFPWMEYSPPLNENKTTKK